MHFGTYWYSQVKYRRGSVWRVLQAEGVFGEKIAVDSKWNILINNKGFFFISTTPNNKDIHLGKRDSNVEGDLVVEHHNISFKVCIFCFFYWHKILVEMDVCIQETLENLKGSYAAMRTTELPRWPLVSASRRSWRPSSTRAMLMGVCDHL